MKEEGKKKIPKGDDPVEVEFSSFLEDMEVVGKKCQGVYSSLDDRTRLTYSCTLLTAYIG